MRSETAQHNRPKPVCIVVTGQAGAGKTTLAKKLGAALWMPVISRDEIKEGYVNTFRSSHGELPHETDGYVTDTFFDLVARYLGANVSIVIEAAFQHKVWDSRFAKIRETGTPIVVICSIDPVIAAKRHLQRGLEQPNRTRFHEDNRVTHYLKTGEFLYPAQYDPPDLGVLTIRVSTDGEYSPSIENIVKQIELHRNSGDFVEA